MTAVALLLIGLAALLIWAGVKGENPVDVVVATINNRPAGAA